MSRKVRVTLDIMTEDDVSDKEISRWDFSDLLGEDCTLAAIGDVFTEAERLEHVEAAGNVSYDQGKLDGGSDHVGATHFAKLLQERLAACESRHAMLRNSFAEAGGRGVDLADDIDAVKREIDQIQAVLTLVVTDEEV